MPTANPNEVLLDIRNMKKWFPVKRGVFLKSTQYVKAVDDISLTIRSGETLGIVGESGCGKSTLARVILRLIEPTGGEAIFSGKDVFTLSPADLRQTKRDMQIIFQDPYASLNPRMKVHDILSEPFIIHHTTSKKDALNGASKLLDMVGLNQDSMGKYPHEFSGGQRQRLCIARALALRPKLIICDECVSALDVSIQAQIINLLIEMQKQLGLTLVFISHDLRVVQHISTHVAVMYLGKIVEYASKKELFQNPLHPYTKALLSAVPVADPGRPRQRVKLEGDIPSPINLPSGCSFSTRCPVVCTDCRKKEPALVQTGPEHFSRCLYINNINN